MIENPVPWVVDDEPLVRELVAAALERDGYTVLAAASADQALGLDRDHPGEIDLVLTDVAMPGLRGPDLVALLAAGRPGLRALYMSGYAGGAEAAAAAPLLAKPFGLAALRHAVGKALAEARAA